MEKKKGFTLVELLAVIAILAILVIIALPNVINMYTKAQKEAFLTETKKIYSEAEKKYISSSISGNANTIINSEDDSKLDMTGEKLQYCILLYNNGKVKDLKVSNGKWIASLDNSKTIEELTIDDLEEGNLDDYDCKGNQVLSPAPVYCTFDGEMVQGAQYTDGQYTYYYKQKYDEYWDVSVHLYLPGWVNISEDVWGVKFNDTSFSGKIDSKFCTYINNKPVVEVEHMFEGVNAETVDLNKFDFSLIKKGMFSGATFSYLDFNGVDLSMMNNMDSLFYGLKAKEFRNFNKVNTFGVTSMKSMFAYSKINELDLRSFDTSKVTDMSEMFNNADITKIDLSSFDTSNVTNMNHMFSGVNMDNVIGFNKLSTKNVTSMYGMFMGAKWQSLDFNNFDTSKVTDMTDMFFGSNAPTIDLSSFDTSSVTHMYRMFYDNKATSLNLSSFNTSNVTDMIQMFANSKASTLDLSSFDTSKVTDMSFMFSNSAATTGYARTQTDADKFNSTSYKPSGLNFIVK